MTRIERSRRVVLNGKLDCLGDFRPSELSNDAQRKINPGGDSACSEDVAVAHDAPLLVTGTDQWQQVGIGPMCRGPAPLKQPSCAEKKCADAYGCYILRPTRLTANEVYHLNIGDSFDNAGTPRNANQVEGWRSLKSACWQEAQTAIT